jgi:hypothetical protein
MPISCFDPIDDWADWHCYSAIRPIACARKFPDYLRSFLVLLHKFPVPVRREFGSKSSNIIALMEPLMA